ncbi:hypothetical protein QCA50_007259 [Cerrena zonata]|uniref:Uncharacterized protein n=1 Tax=Cerrena zonata TaxID=2478898 RepID=A0AAW0GAM9_9APHY
MSLLRDNQFGHSNTTFLAFTHHSDIEPITPQTGANDTPSDSVAKLSEGGHSQYEGLLFNGNTKSKSGHSLSIAQGRRLDISLKFLVPLILIVVGVAGLGTLFLVWLFLNQIEGHDVWKDKALFLDEGTHLEGDTESARLLGLTISSGASKAVTFTTPFLVGLYSFYVARTWLRSISSGKPNLPTPLQYGLVVNLLSDIGLGSLITTIRYLFRGPHRRAATTPLLTHVFTMVLLIYILTNAIGIVDLWLHIVTTTVVQHTVTPISTPFHYSIEQVLCPPYPDPWYDAVFPCLITPGGWGNGVASKAPGMLARANNSDSLQTITLADADDLAILVKPNVLQSLNFRATSFGARAECQSVNPLCDPQSMINCTGFPPTFPPYNGSDSVSASPLVREGDSGLFIQSSNCGWNVSEEACPHISSERITTDAINLNPLSPPINAYNMWMQFVWEAEGDQGYGVGAGETSGAVTSYLNVATMLTNCTLRFYNVTIDHSNGSYSLHNEVLSNVGLSDGLAGPSRLGHFASYLVSNIEGRVFTDNSTEELMAFLQQDLARLALGSAAVITNVTSDTLMQSISGSKIVGRYPLWPIFVFLVLVYLYTALALVLFFLTSLTMQTESLVLAQDTDVPGMHDGKGQDRKVSLLELTQMRLRGPLPLVASLFPPHRPVVNREALSIETNVLDMFCEKANHEPVQVGLYSDNVDASLRFRIRRSSFTGMDSSDSSNQDK